MRRSLGRVSLLVALAIALAPAQSPAAVRDVAATHSYIEANYELARASVARLGSAQAKIERFNDRLGRECPHIGLGSPENEASQPISHEVAVALWSIEYGTQAPAIRTFVRTADGLSWGNPAIARSARRYVSSLRELARVALPDLCTDVRAWRASGFGAVPAAIVSLVERVEGLHPQAIPPRLLAPFERGSDASVLARTKRLEARLEENEFLVGQGDWITVLETLGLNE
jgi:hypothetical protein